MAYMTEEEFWDATFVAAVGGLCARLPDLEGHQPEGVAIDATLIADYCLQHRREHTEDRIKTLSDVVTKPAHKSEA